MIRKESGKTQSTRSAFSSYSGLSATLRNQFVRGQPPVNKDEKYPRSVNQCGADHQHSKRPGKKADTGCDSEARLLYGLRNRNKESNPAQLIFRIDWRKKDIIHRIPCEDCFRLMCHAKANCNVEVFVCNDENKPIELTDEDCINEKEQGTGYDDFKERVLKGGT